MNNPQKVPTKSSKGNTKALDDKSKPTKKRPERFCNFVFTLFAEEPLEYDPEKMQWLAYGKETCPTTGRLHWQSFVGFHQDISGFMLKKYLKDKTGLNPHFEGMKGSIYHNEVYCSKEGTLQKFGTFPNQGLRSDLLWWKERIMEGTHKPSDILLENPVFYHQYGRTIKDIFNLRCKDIWRTEMTTCDWYHGGTGTGKSHRALQNYNPRDIYIYCRDNGWWDNYEMQACVVINEFREGTLSFDFLLEMIDKWPFSVKRRNTTPLPFISKHVIITSPYNPADMFVSDGVNNVDQLLRRIKVHHLNVKYEELKSEAKVTDI